LSAFRRSAGLSTRHLVTVLAFVAMTFILLCAAAGSALATPPFEETQVEIELKGRPAVGETLTCAIGSWTGTPKFEFEWLRDGVVFEEGLETGSYLVKAEDEGHTLTCIVLASVGVGTANEETTEEESVNGIAIPGGSKPQAPKNTSPPTITGSAEVGATLHCESGAWSGTQPISFEYEWLRNGSKIASASGGEYKVQSADEGTSISCKVTASNSGGKETALSKGVQIPALHVPADETPPEVVGTPAVGQELTCNPGKWSGEPTFTYQWLSNGAETGVTAQVYVVKSGDRGHSIACRVTATNRAGSGSPATSAGRTVAGKGPEDLTPPRVTGEPKVGNTVHCEVGTWSGEPAPELHYRWVRDLGQVGKEVGVGSKDAPYQVQSADAGNTLACQVTASNGEGSPVVEDSPPVAVPTGNVNEPQDETPPTVSGQEHVGGKVECLHGEWSPKPEPTFEYRWVRNPGAAGEAIVGEAKTYEVATADGGQTLACTVIASNSAGVAIAKSTAVAIAGVIPSNTLAPEIFLGKGAGAGAVGETLTCTHGEWNAAPAPAFEYQWVRNPGAGFGSETAIASATSSSYVVKPADEGYLLVCEVTAKNGVGQATARASNEVPIPGSEPERNEAAPPRITGQPTIGEALTCSSGQWTGAPQPIIEYQWLLEGVPIPGANKNVFPVVAPDASRVLTCEVTARNREGKESAVSAGVRVPGAKPENTELPQITGSARLNGSLTCMHGEWNAKPVPSFTYEWLREGSTIVAPTSSPTYTVEQADTGHSLTCKVIALNADGTGEATSGSVEIPGGTSKVEGRLETNLPSPGVIQPTATTAQILAVLGTELTRAQRGARISSLVKVGHYAFAFTAPGAGTLDLFWYEVPKGAHVSSAKSKPKPVLVAYGAVSFAAGAKKTVLLRLTNAGRKLLKHSKSVKLTAKGVFTPTGGHAVTWLKSFVLSH
jgi:hypothetical protein